MPGVFTVDRKESAQSLFIFQIQMSIINLSQNYMYLVIVKELILKVPHKICSTFSFCVASLINQIRIDISVDHLLTNEYVKPYPPPPHPNMRECVKEYFAKLNKYPSLARFYLTIQQTKSF